jgi:hypothetical protein
MWVLGITGTENRALTLKVHPVTGSRLLGVGLRQIAHKVLRHLILKVTVTV